MFVYMCLPMLVALTFSTLITNGKNDCDCAIDAMCYEIIGVCCFLWALLIVKLITITNKVILDVIETIIK
jgi:hypothetical protein